MTQNKINTIDPAPIIQAYIDKKNITVEIFARQCKVSAQHIHNWLSGRCKMRDASALKIERYTRREITFEQLSSRKRPRHSLRGTQLVMPF